ncbi:hypothetical protein BO94DRAFT_534667 [Aspergillus sclerotioniger CBS 115572]|uniref:Uncharacterized protein n=1 Tax=Aspergillus sclerotioniger CBS 115572 TaxID=1450535 RepID=A0A317WSP4_9EURO|nr:hypothetical protein BO94DRAFT_534667 [Aspergillus sclerotioniger CBS 115572]PWY88761.1 hypothetical protein BO94DRAFT_534667 [Aspergillus sclerotioniger CBS 115572]
MLYSVLLSIQFSPPCYPLPPEVSRYEDDVSQSLPDHTGSQLGLYPTLFLRMGLPHRRDLSGSDDGFGLLSAKEFPSWVKVEFWNELRNMGGFKG